MPRAFVRLRGRPSAESGAAGFDFSGEPCYTYNIPFWPGKTPTKSLCVKEEMQYEGSQIPEKTADLLLRDGTARGAPVQYGGFTAADAQPRFGGGLRNLYEDDRGEKHRRGRGR